MSDWVGGGTGTPISTALSGYDLAVQGIRDFARFGRVLEQQAISLDPLHGVVDGVNRTFHTNYAPILTSGSLAVVTSGSAAAGSANYDTGEITLNAAPQVQPFASYTFTPWTSLQVLQFLLRGFDHMEGRWRRGYQVHDSAGNPATEASANLYVVDSDGNEPSLNGVLFSRSRAQIAFLMVCCERAFLGTHLRTGARLNFMWRETVRGMTVDKSKVPANLQLAVDDVERELQSILFEAQEEYYGDSGYGGAIVRPATAHYLAAYEWQTASIEGDYRNTLGYQYALRPLWT